jgi:hypothetical protein
MQVAANMRPLGIIMKDVKTSLRTFTLRMIKICSRREVLRALTFQKKNMTQSDISIAEAFIGPILKAKLSPALVQTQASVEKWHLYESERVFNYIFFMLNSIYKINGSS